MALRAIIPFYEMNDPRTASEKIKYPYHVEQRDLLVERNAVVWGLYKDAKYVPGYDVKDEDKELLLARAGAMNVDSAKKLGEPYWPPGRDPHHKPVAYMEAA